MSYISCFEKRNYYIRIKLNIKNNRITETIYYKNNSNIVDIHTCIFPTKLKSINQYSDRIKYLNTWGYKRVEENRL